MLMLLSMQAVKNKNSNNKNKRKNMLEKETLKESLSTPRGWLITTVAAAMMFGNILATIG